MNAPGPFHRDAGKPREAEGTAGGNGQIDDPAAHIRTPVGNRDGHTAPIRAVGDAHAATEWQSFVRSRHLTIMQRSTASRPRALFARRIARCDTAFGTPIR